MIDAEVLKEAVLENARTLRLRNDARRVRWGIGGDAYSPSACRRCGGWHEARQIGRDGLCPWCERDVYDHAMERESV